MPDTLHEDIRAAMTGSSNDVDGSQLDLPLDDTSKETGFEQQRSEVLPPVYPDSKEVKGPQRGPDGKFLPKEAGEQPPAPAVQPKQPQTPQQPQQLGTEQPAKLDPSKPPAAWTPEMKAKWGTVPKDIREEITRREEATMVGIQKLQQHYAPMEDIYNVLVPHGEYFQHIQEDPRQYLTSMIGMEQTLRLGNPAQKIEMLLALADVYGVPMRDTLDSALGGKLNDMMQQAHNKHQTPMPLPPEVQQELISRRQWQSQIEDLAAQSELDQFAQQPGHEFLEHVRDDMANIIESGFVTTYEEAYELACFTNPQIRQAVMSGQRPMNRIQQRQQAAGSIVSPGNAPLVMDGGEGDVPDDIHDAVRQAWNRSATGGV